MIKRLYKGPNNERYFQKSRVFLYPVLETKKIGTIIPINTFISWTGKYTQDDRKLLCTFKLEGGDKYRDFEKKALIRNELFYDFKEGEGETGIYIFDFTNFAVDWDLFLKGAYSRMKVEVKSRIKRYYNGNNSNSVYVDSFLNPKKYYEIYSHLLNVRESDLRGGELCDPPNFQKEHLNMLVKDLSIKDNSVNSQEP